MKNYFLVSEKRYCGFDIILRYTLTNNSTLNHDGWEFMKTRSVEPKSLKTYDRFCIESEQSQMYGDIESLLGYVKNHPDEEFEWYSPSCGRVGVEIEEENEDE